MWHDINRIWLINSHAQNDGVVPNSPILFCINFGEFSPKYAGEDLIFNAVVLYSNVWGLCQASGELCVVCMAFYPSITVCQRLTFPNSFCPPSYVVAARPDRSRYGGGIVILIQEHMYGSYIVWRNQHNCDFDCWESRIGHYYYSFLTICLLSVA